MEKQIIKTTCYLKTDPKSSYFRIREEGILTIKLDTLKIINTKGINSAPHRLVPSSLDEFESAREKVLNELNEL